MYNTPYTIWLCTEARMHSNYRSLVIIIPHTQMERIKRNISLFLTELSNCYERIYDIPRHSFTPRDSCMQDVSSCDNRATFIFIIYFESPAFEDKYSKRNWHERIVLFKWSIENMSIDEEKRKKKQTQKKNHQRNSIFRSRTNKLCAQIHTKTT